MKELSIYYGRIVLIFILIWFPGIVLISVGGDPSNPYSDEFGSKVFCIGLLLCSLQPTVSTCLAMTKSDVKAAIYDLVTLSYCRRSEKAERTTVAPRSKETEPETPVEPRLVGTDMVKVDCLTGIRHSIEAPPMMDM